MAALTRVPGRDAVAVGLFNLRGHVVPVWNLRVPFQLNDDTLPERAPSVLMVEPDAAQPSRVAGLLVDRVSDVLDFPPGTSSRPRSWASAAARRSCAGLIRHQDRFLLVLDLDRVFAALARRPLERGPLTCPPGPTPSAPAPEPWSDEDFRPVEAVLRARPHGGALAPQRLGLIRARLRARLQARGIPSFAWFHDHHLTPEPTARGCSC